MNLSNYIILQDYFNFVNTKRQCKYFIWYQTHILFVYILQLIRRTTQPNLLLLHLNESLYFFLATVCFLPIAITPLTFLTALFPENQYEII